MPTQCASPIKAQVARFTRLDECGAPIYGENSSQVTIDGFTQIENETSYEEGERYLLRKANGAPCVNQRDSGFFNWLEQTVTLCTLNPDLLVIATGESLIMDGENATGVAFGGGLLTARFSLEVWQQVAGEGACTSTGQQRYVYWAFPNVGDAQIQSFTFENGTFTLSFLDTTQAASDLWIIGDPWLGDGVNWGNDNHYAFNVTTMPPPEPGCDATEVVEPSS